MTSKRHEKRTLVYRVNKANVITFVGEEWEAFAAANGAPELSASRVIGQKLWKYISDHPTRSLYEAMLKKVRSQRCAVHFPYRCDAPDRRRFMELEIRPTGENEVEFRSRLVREEKRPTVPLLDPRLPHVGRAIHMCSWCKKVHLNQWIEVEDAIRQRKLFDTVPVPGVLHGICSDCLTKLRLSLKQPLPHIAAGDETASNASLTE